MTILTLITLFATLTATSSQPSDLCDIVYTDTGLTRAELAEITGVNASAIYRLEGGHDVRLSSHFPIVQYFATREHPRAWLLAERLALLPAAHRAEILAALDDAERDGDAHG